MGQKETAGAGRDLSSPTAPGWQCEGREMRRGRKWWLCLGDCRARERNDGGCEWVATEAEDDGVGIGREREGREGVRQRCCRSSAARCQQGHFGNFIAGVLL